MRKTTILMAAALSLASLAVYPMIDGDDPIPFKHGRINYDPTQPPPHKSPIEIPLVYQDGNTLTFATPCTGCTLQILDEDDDVVYETTVASGTTSVILPDATLLGGTGTYELRLIYGDIYFYADITL